MAFNAYMFYSEAPDYSQIRIYLKDGNIDEGILLAFDDVEDNDIDDALVLDVDGDTTIGRAVYQKDIERVEVV
jgi:hypothetical protein